jgi:hypothetical protein
MKGRVDKELVLLKGKLTDLQQQTSPFKVYIQKEVPMLENLLEYYRKSDGATKKKVLGCIFAEKLVLENGKDEWEKRRRGDKKSPIFSMRFFSTPNKRKLQPDEWNIDFK